jgi:hypothetical protein
MTTRSGAVGNDLTVSDYSEVAPEDLLRDLRGVVSRYRHQVLPALVPEQADQIDVTAEWIMAEELAGLVGRIEAVEAELLQRPRSAEVRRRASELVLAANVLASVALRIAAATGGAAR